jgi:hypothetical protein
LFSNKIKREVKNIVLTMMENNDLVFKKLNWNNLTISFYVPYDRNLHAVEFSGEDVNDIIEVIKENINMELEEMINHLGDCKL